MLKKKIKKKGIESPASLPLKKNMNASKYFNLPFPRR